MTERMPRSSRYPRGMVSILFLFLISVPLFAGEKSYQFGESIVKTDPESLPDGLPTGFLFPGSTIRLSGFSHGSGYVVQAQGAVYLETKSDLRTVDDFYESFITESAWKVIQSKKSEDLSFIMAESPFRKVVTIIITGQSNVSIRIYFRKSGGNDA